jgi:hypothetical protein
VKKTITAVKILFASMDSNWQLVRIIFRPKPDLKRSFWLKQRFIPEQDLNELIKIPGMKPPSTAPK